MADIGTHVRGIAFLGTPFRGSEKAKWAQQGAKYMEWLGQKVDKDTLQLLEKDSASLQALTEQFAYLMQGRLKTKIEIKVAFFWEEEQSRMLVKYGKVKDHTFSGIHHPINVHMG